MDTRTLKQVAVGHNKFRVLRVHDSYKINPPSKNDRSRKIVLFLQFLGYGAHEITYNIPIVRSSIFLFPSTKSKFPENHSLYSLSGICSIANQSLSDIPRDISEEFAVQDSKDGILYDMENMAQNLHINCSALIGREFIANVYSTSVVGNNVYVNFSPKSITYNESCWEGPPDQSNDIFRGYDMPSQMFFRIINGALPLNDFSKSFWNEKEDSLDITTQDLPYP